MAGCQNASRKEYVVTTEPTTIFSTLANDTRLRCLYLVATNGEVCVGEIVEALVIPQPSASKALNDLKRAGLLYARKKANRHYFSLNTAVPEWAAAVVDATVCGLRSSPTHTMDQKRFRPMTKIHNGVSGTSPPDISNSL
jgi:ArsR family transcriptional regulator, arsenate/arsenite/antimonite-responsive transcriptional repressor